MRVFCAEQPIPPRYAPEWAEIDNANLRGFLNTASGVKLRDLLRFTEAANNAGAVIRHDRHEYACGFAAGYRGCAAQIGILSELRPPQATENEQLTPRGAEELIEMLAP